MATFLKLPLLFATGVVAGLIDAIAGGGGLITIPVLVSTGMPPQTVLGTNKLQGTFGSGSAMLHFFRAGTADIRDCAAGIAWTALSAALGSLVVQVLDPAFLQRVIPVLLFAIALSLLVSLKLGMEDEATAAKLPRQESGACCGRGVTSSRCAADRAPSGMPSTVRAIPLRVPGRYQ